MCWYIDYVSLGQLYFYFVLQCHMSLILSFFFYYGGILFFSLCITFCFKLYVSDICCSEYWMHTFLILKIRFRFVIKMCKLSTDNRREREWMDCIVST